MKTNTKKVVSILNDLIETCLDGENGFRTAAEDVKDDGLRDLFTRLSQQRSEFGAELKTLVSGLGGMPEETGTAAGAAHRGWINMKSAVTGRDNAAIVAEAERGEDHAKAVYAKALEGNLPADVHSVVQRQYAGVLEAHDTVRRLEQKPHILNV